MFKVAIAFALVNFDMLVAYHRSISQFDLKFLVRLTGNPPTEMKKRSALFDYILPNANALVHAIPPAERMALLPCKASPYVREGCFCVAIFEEQAWL